MVAIRRPIKVYEHKRKEEVFQWFEESGLEYLKESIGDEANITYKTDDTGITVTIITEKLLILNDFDRDLLKVLKRVATITAEATEDGCIKIQLWFRGWVWAPKEEEGGQ